MSISIRLYHCPFCGYPADFRIHPRAAVFCTNPACGVSMERDGIEIADVRTCAARWNERQEPQIEGVEFEWPSRRVEAR